MKLKAEIERLRAAKMTERQALLVLFDCASRVCRGSGTGISSGVPNRDEREQIRDAVRRLWPKANKWEFTENDLLNMGL